MGLCNITKNSCAGYKRTTVCTAATSTHVSPSSSNVLYGRITSVGNSGARVLVGNSEEAAGFVPRREAPLAVDFTGSTRSSLKELFPLGLTREFAVLDGVENAADGKAGQVLSARAIDRDILWSRVAQMLAISKERCENFGVTISGVNAKGLTASLSGLPAFIPVSQIEKKSGGTWWTEEEMNSEFLGRQMSVAVTEISRNSKKVVCSALKAKENDVLRSLEVGSLLKGTVRRVESYGAFVGIPGTRASGLLHVSNISRAHVQHPSMVFSVGDEICCIVVGMEDNYSNFSLSTAELEPEDGDITTDKAAVWANAEEQAAQFRNHLAKLND